MQDLDCFLFIDMNLPEEERRMSVLCVECHNEKMPDTGIFYNGSLEGYSNYNWKCCICNKLIHKSEEGDQDEESETSSENSRS